jgi:ankyrin repeat protein
MNKIFVIASLCLALLCNSLPCSAKDTSTTGTTEADALLLNAAYNDNYNKVLKALKQNANVNSAGEYGQTALYWSLANGNLKLAQLLVDKGADVLVRDSFNETLLFSALTTRVYEETLLGKPNKHTRPSLTQRRLMVEFLLKKGVDPTLEDNMGSLPLHVAVGGLSGEYHDHIKLITLLLPDKALLHHKNQYGFTPIDMAKDPKIKAYLLSLLDK